MTTILSVPARLNYGPMRMPLYEVAPGLTVGSAILKGDLHGVYDLLHVRKAAVPRASKNGGNPRSRKPETLEFRRFTGVHPLLADVELELFVITIFRMSFPIISILC